MDEGELQSWADSLNFRHDRQRRRIVCDDPGIWVEDLGTPVEYGHTFILSLHGARIGFAEPGSDMNLLQEFDLARVEDGEYLAPPSFTWLITSIGGFIAKGPYRGGNPWEETNRGKFLDRREQAMALCIIRAALSRHFRDAPEKPPLVGFGKRLIQRLEDGELIYTDKERDLWLAAQKEKQALLAAEQKREKATGPMRTVLRLLRLRR